MFESEAHTERGSPSLVGRGIANPYPQFSSFESYLKSQNKRNIRQIICYAQKYHNVLETGNATPIVNIQSGAVRRHTMEALTALSKYNGSYDRWQQIRKCYSLKWTNGNESLQSLQRFFNPDLSLDHMIQKVKEMICVLPRPFGTVIKFACLTGLRPSECVESVKLLNSEGANCYYNPEQQRLEHFRFPEIFIRRTKVAYISIITKEQLSGIGILGSRTPTYSSVRHKLNRMGLSMNMNYCRKIFSSYLRQHAGIESEIIDLLQGRVGKSIFIRHYYTPSLSYRDKVIDAVTKLKTLLEDST
jgi:hypothetical protein